MNSPSDDSRTESVKPSGESAAGSRPKRLVMKAGPEGVLLDFNYGARVKVPEGHYHVRFTDLDTMSVLFDEDVSGCYASSSKKYYIRFLTEIWKDGTRIVHHCFDCRGKNVHIVFPKNILGDVLCWMPYAEAFRVQHGCRLFCTVPESLAALLSSSFPEVVFLPPDGTVPECYATYYLGISAVEDRGFFQPMDFRTVGLWQSIPPILGLKTEELRLKLKTSPVRTIPEPYVCIAVQASMQMKYWNNPRGWPQVVRYLKERGYRVLCIDRDRSIRRGAFENSMPDGAEDFTGNLPLQQRADLLAHADFFVGLSSGLSWLAWAVGIPVVMISGFTLPFNEFSTPYRVINYHVCTGCWNDCRIEPNYQDFMWCPRYGGTERAFECSRYINPEHVCKTIDRLMTEEGLDPKRTE